MTEKENKNESNQQSILEDLAVNGDKADEVKGGGELTTDAQALSEALQRRKPVGQAGAGMQDTEKGVTGMFA